MLITEQYWFDSHDIYCSLTLLLLLSYTRFIMYSLMLRVFIASIVVSNVAAQPNANHLPHRNDNIRFPVPPPPPPQDQQPIQQYYFVPHSSPQPQELCYGLPCDDNIRTEHPKDKHDSTEPSNYRIESSINGKPVRPERPFSDMTKRLTKLARNLTEHSRQSISTAVEMIISAMRNEPNDKLNLRRRREAELEVEGNDTLDGNYASLESNETFVERNETTDESNSLYDELETIDNYVVLNDTEYYFINESYASLVNESEGDSHNETEIYVLDNSR